jgi:hypothetical protein
MSFRILCYTLFDVTFSEMNIRAKPDPNNTQEWIKKRNSKCNFDTIQQLISLRSQPEIVVFPKMIHFTDNTFFGTRYKSQNLKGWKFVFEVQHAKVFDLEEEKLKLLYTDCHNVPMLLTGEEINSLSPILETTLNNKNIHFEYE